MLLPLINQLCLRQAKRWTTGKTIFALDSGDITHGNSISGDGEGKTKNQPRFLYCQLLKGLQRMFRGFGCIFRFRSTRISRWKDRWEVIERPLFDYPAAFLEVV